MRLLFIFIFLLTQISSFAQIKVKDKIYVQQDTFFIPSNLLALQAIVYKNSVNLPVTNSEEKVLYISLSPLMKYNIKYSITQTQEFLGFSHTGYSRNGWFVQPRTIAFPLHNLNNISSPVCSHFLKVGNPTSFYINTNVAIEKSPLDILYHPRHRHPPIKDIRIDFASGGKYFYYSAIIEKELKVFSYKIPANKFEGFNKKNWQIGNKEYDVIPVERKQTFKIDIEEDFYTFFIHNQLYLLTIKGQLFSMSRKEAKKIRQLPIQLGKYALIINKDEQKAYTIDKIHLNENIPFKEIMKKYANQIDLE